jgi:hypothetical protein
MKENSRGNFLKGAAATTALLACRQFIPAKSEPDDVIDQLSDSTAKPTTEPESIVEPQPFWPDRSIDTMKVSRDMARRLLKELEQGNNPSHLPFMLEKIKAANANMVAFGTPYDQEFIPLLAWEIQAAQDHGLNVFLRGNFSGWEGWFDYPKFTEPDQHHRLTRDFIINNPHLFVANGLSKIKYFSPAPEPENGFDNVWASDTTKQLFHDWLITSYQNTTAALEEIGANHTRVVYSFNGDVAQIIPLEIINSDYPLLIDHYISDVNRYRTDISGLSRQYEGAPVGLGEIGAPIPDIHGEMTEPEQAEFIRQMLTVLTESKLLIPIINYWHLFDPHDKNQSRSTALLNSDGTERLAYQVIQEFYR